MSTKRDGFLSTFDPDVDKMCHADLCQLVISEYSENYMIHFWNTLKLHLNVLFREKIFAKNTSFSKSWQEITFQQRCPLISRLVHSFATRCPLIPKQYPLISRHVHSFPKTKHTSADLVLITQLLSHSNLWKTCFLSVYAGLCLCSIFRFPVFSLKDSDTSILLTTTSIFDDIWVSKIKASTR